MFSVDFSIDFYLGGEFGTHFCLAQGLQKEPLCDPTRFLIQIVWKIMTREHVMSHTCGKVHVQPQK